MNKQEAVKKAIELSLYDPTVVIEAKDNSYTVKFFYYEEVDEQKENVIEGYWLGEVW